MKALTVLRSASIEKAATEAFKNVLNVRKSLDDGIIQLATQQKDLFPKKCTEILNEAKTHDNVVAILARLSKDEPVSLVGIIGATADCHQLLQTSTRTNDLDIKEVSTKMTNAYEDAVTAWIATSSAFEGFGEAHDFFKAVVPAA
eukprot:6237645-Pyramimonas_sp.AAC.1